MERVRQEARKEMKALALTLLLLCSSCSVTIVYAPKEVCIHDGENHVEITGSDLKGNTASQSASGELKIPLIP